jgi:hypothetical protein
MNARTLGLIALMLLSMLLLSACAAGPNPLEGVPTDGGQLAGFWLGLWHGIISPVTFIISIFVQDVRFYEVHNNGIWYNLGFVIGAGILFGGSARAGRRR